jgi:hypothetical protein
MKILFWILSRRIHENPDIIDVMIEIWWKNKLCCGFLSASELYRLSDCHFLLKFSAKFVDRGVSRGQRGGSPTVTLSFLERSRYFSFK